MCICVMIFTLIRYMAELTKELFKGTEDAGHHAAEYRISIYGRYNNLFIYLFYAIHLLYSKRNEWALLARWVHDFNV
jgi:hypothetical protein